MKETTRRTPVLIAAAAFLAAALFLLVVGARETGQAAAPGQASVEPGRRLADLFGRLRDGRFAGLRARVRSMARMRAMRLRQILRRRRW